MALRVRRTIGQLIDWDMPARAQCATCRRYRDIDLPALAAKVGRDYSLWNRRCRCRLAPGCTGWIHFFVGGGWYHLAADEAVEWRWFELETEEQLAAQRRLDANAAASSDPTMCNEAARRIELEQLRVDWSETRIELRFPEGAPNMAPIDSLRITDPSVIIRPAEAGAAELVTRRWSWPGPGGKPVYNFRSDGRKLNSGRCLIPVDSFFEFTALPAGAPRRAPKSKWRFSVPGRPWFCIAGIWRRDPAIGEAWSMLTTEPGPDVAPYHSRQVVVLPDPPAWAAWLDSSIPSADLCKPAPAGTLLAERVR